MPVLLQPKGTGALIWTIFPKYCRKPGDSGSAETRSVGSHPLGSCCLCVRSPLTRRYPFLPPRLPQRHPVTPVTPRYCIPPWELSQSLGEPGSWCLAHFFLFGQGSSPEPVSGAATPPPLPPLLRICPSWGSCQQLWVAGCRVLPASQLSRLGPWGPAMGFTAACFSWI